MIRVAQEDFSGGIWHQPDAPAGHVYDAVNACIDGTDLVRRGGSAYLGSLVGDVPFGSPWDGVAAVDLGGVRQRVLAWNANDGLVVLDDTATSMVSLGEDAPPGFSRPVGVGGMIALPDSLNTNRYILYAGSRVTAPYVTGTLTVTHGSRAITVSGGNFSLSGRDSGSLVVTTNGYGILESIQNSTNATVQNPWIGPTESTAYSMKMTGPITASQFTDDGTPLVLAAAANRLFALKGNRMAFSQRDNPVGFLPLDFDEISSDAKTLGAVGFRDNLMWFTSRGVWVASNLAFDLTDDAGNPQWRVQQVNPDLHLWGSPLWGGACGVASWGGALIVPTVDGVVLMSADGAVSSIGAGIDSLVRGYVRAGYMPGMAAVFEGHYFLPVVNVNGFSGTLLRDVLVCKLEPRPAWTRWSGHAQSRAYTVLSPFGGQAASLYGANGQRFTNLSATLPPVNGTNDADGSVQQFQVVTNDLPTGEGGLNTVLRLRVRAVADPGATLQAAYGVGDDGTFFAALTPDAAGQADGAPVQWTIVDRARKMRFRVQSSGSALTLRLRGLYMFVRPSDRP